MSSRYVRGSASMKRQRTQRRGPYGPTGTVILGRASSSAARAVASGDTVLLGGSGYRGGRQQGEKKGMDTALTVASVTHTMTNADSSHILNLIQQGAGSWNRVGRKVALHSLRLRIDGNYSYVVAPTTGNLYGVNMRMLVVYDNQPSGAAQPGIDDIIGVTTQSGGEGSNYLDPIKYDAMGRFTILRDKVISLNPPTQNTGAGTTHSVSQSFHLDEYIKLSGLGTIFSGQSNPMTIADIASGALYVYFRKNANTGTVEITDESRARLRYID